MSDLIKLLSNMTEDELFERHNKLDIETDYMQEKLDLAHEEFDKAMTELNEIEKYLDVFINKRKK